MLQTDCSGYVAQTPSLIKPVEQESASLDQANLIKKSLSTLKILVEEANAHKVQIFLYVTPHNHHFLDKINLDLYLFFLKSLSDIAPFWNFGFYSDFTVNDCNYYESSHYAPHSAPLIFQAMNSLQNSLIAHRVSSNSIASEIIFIKDNFRAHKNR